MKSTVTVSVVVVYEAITPSIKLAGVPVLTARTLCPAANAEAAAVALTVNAFEPVPIARDVVDVNAV